MAEQSGLLGTAPDRHWQRRTLTVVTGSLCLSILMAFAPPTHDATAAGPGSSYYFSRMNQERADNGQGPLSWASDLAGVADRWAAHMASTQRLAHNPNLQSEVANWRAVGENVGEGSSIEDLDRAFYASPEHRANILDQDFRQVGVGSVQQSGTLWIAIVFRDPLHTTSYSAPAPRSQPVSTTSSAPASTPTAPTIPKVVALGATGQRVERVQDLLVLGTSDGVFDRRTQHAVRLFQRSFGLPVTGRVGPRTLTRLRLVHAKFRASARLVREGVRLPTTGVKGVPAIGCMTGVGRG